MSNRRRLALLSCLAGGGALLIGSARSEALYKDAERFGPAAESQTYETGPNAPRRHDHGRPARRVTGGPGYAGSEYGLGKPAFTGLGSRPDWGRSSD